VPFNIALVAVTTDGAAVSAIGFVMVGVVTTSRTNITKFRYDRILGITLPKSKFIIQELELSPIGEAVHTGNGIISGKISLFILGKLLL